MATHIELQEFLNQLSQLLNKAIFLLGGIGAALTFSIAYFSNLFAKKVQLNWQKLADQENEKVKGDINRNNSIIAALLGQHGQTNQKVLDKQIESIQKAWENVLKLRSSVPGVVALSYNIFSDDELENGILDEDRGRGILGDLVNDISIKEITELSAIQNEMRKLRPFLSHKLSLQLFVYGAVLGRLVFILSDSYKKGKVKVWRKDSGLKQLLQTVLNEKEIGHIYSLNIQGFDIVVDLLETKILNEMNFIISGQKNAEDALSLVDKWALSREGQVVLERAFYK